MVAPIPGMTPKRQIPTNVMVQPHGFISCEPDFAPIMPSTSRIGRRHLPPLTPPPRGQAFRQEPLERVLEEDEEETGEWMCEVSFVVFVRYLFVVGLDWWFGDLNPWQGEGKWETPPQPPNHNREADFGSQLTHNQCVMYTCSL